MSPHDHDRWYDDGGLVPDRAPDHAATPRHENGPPLAIVLCDDGEARVWTEDALALLRRSLQGRRADVYRLQPPAEV